MHLKCYKRCKAVNIAVFLLTLFLLQIVFPGRVNAEPNTNTMPNIDVVFVLDASKSMLTSDKDKVREEAIKMFVDMCQPQGDRAALVAFTDAIVKNTGFLSLNGAADKDTFKKQFSDIKLGEWTNIGLALKTAVDILDNSHDQAKRPIIILLSDGKNDPGNGKLPASQQIQAAAIEQARAKKYPIYTIGLNADGSVDRNAMEMIASETAGKCQITNTASELKNLLLNIYADSTKQNLTGGNAIDGTGSYQDVKVNIPIPNIPEANISILSSSKLDIKVFDPAGKEQAPSDKIIISGSNGYSVVKLINPAKGDWLLKVQGAKGDKISAKVLYNIDLKLDITLNPEKDVHKGDTLKISAALSNNNTKIADEEFYKNITASVIVKKPSDKDIKPITLVYKNGVFEGEYKIPEKEKYEVRVTAQGGVLEKPLEGAKEVTAVNRAPSVAGKLQKLSLAPDNKTKIIYVSQYFSDGDGDNLTYEIKDPKSDFLSVSLSGDGLSITPRKKGSASITLTANDGNGGTVSQSVDIQVNSKLYQILHDMYIIIILGLIILLSVVFLVRTEIKLRKFK